MGLYFADTYALVEIAEGNEKYVSILKGNDIITSRPNLMELYYGLLLKKGEGMAEAFYEFFLPRIVDYNDISIKSAMKFRFANKAKKLSYVDCMGYQIALENNVKFLTGDMAFRGIPNVEYVK